MEATRQENAGLHIEEESVWQAVGTRLGGPVCLGGLRFLSGKQELAFLSRVELMR